MRKFCTCFAEALRREQGCLCPWHTCEHPEHSLAQIAGCKFLINVSKLLCGLLLFCMPAVCRSLNAERASAERFKTAVLFKRPLRSASYPGRNSVFAMRSIAVSIHHGGVFLL